MDLMPALAGLSEKQRLYVQARLEGDGPETAARRAGCKSAEKSWRIMEHHPTVSAALAKGREISAQATGVTREKITEMFLEAYRNATTAAEQVMAAKELGRLHGLYEAQKVNHAVRVEQVRAESELRSLSVDELERLAVLDGEFLDITPTEEKQLVRLDHKG